MKKFAVLFLSLVLIFCFFAPVFAEEEHLNYERTAEVLILKLAKESPSAINLEDREYGRLTATACPVLQYNRYGETKTLKEANRVPDEIFTVLFEDKKPIAFCTIKEHNERLYVSEMCEKYENIYENLASVKEAHGAEDKEITLFNTYRTYFAVVGKSKAYFLETDGYYDDYLARYGSEMPEKPSADMQFTLNGLIKTSDKINEYVIKDSEDDIMSGNFEEIIKYANLLFTPQKSVLLLWGLIAAVVLILAIVFTASFIIEKKDEKRD